MVEEFVVELESAVRFFGTQLNDLGGTFFTGNVSWNKRTTELEGGGTTHSSNVPGCYLT